MLTRILTGLVHRLALLILLGLPFGWAEKAFASSFAVNPVSLTLTASKRTKLLTITNTGSDDVRLQLDVSCWKQGKKQDATILEPTEDLVVFPLAAAVRHGQSVKIRLGLADRSAVTVEKSYRIVVDELPNAVKNDGSEISFRMILSIPVFVAPAHPRGAVVIGDERLSGGVFFFSLTNPANAHVRLRTVTARGIGTDGKEVFSKNLSAWYLLAGGVREYEVPLGPSECADSAEILLETRSEETGNVANKMARPPKGCTTEAPK